MSDMDRKLKKKKSSFHRIVLGHIRSICLRPYEKHSQISKYKFHTDYIEYSFKKEINIKKNHSKPTIEYKFMGLGSNHKDI